VANLWVDTNGGSCLRQASPSGYADAQACGSWNAAYQAARPGDVVLIKGGSYPDQTVNDRPDLPLGSATIVFHPAPGESITLPGMTFFGHDFVLDGGDTVGADEPNRITFTGTNDAGRSIDVRSDIPGVPDGQHRNVTIEDVHTRNIYYTADYSTLRYSEVGPSTMSSPPFCGDLVLSGDEPVYGWVIEGNLIHDNHGDTCGGDHIDALDLYVIDGVIRGNRIWWCGTQCIFTGDPSSLLIENNMIEETNACGDGCAAPYELNVFGTNTVRYNTIEGGDRYQGTGSDTVYGNVFLSTAPYSCAGGSPPVSYDHNVFPPGSQSCGTSAKLCTPRLADGNLWTNTDRQADYHLAATDTCALGAGTNTYPARDIDQQPRPQNGTTPDAGADER
jgi:hypothetical protein